MGTLKNLLIEHEEERILQQIPSFRDQATTFMDQDQITKELTRFLLHRLGTSPRPLNRGPLLDEAMKMARHYYPYPTEDELTEVYIALDTFLDNYLE